ncbi:hypothetical protein HHI36_012083 [Cryptolaemus montrouzieri]|uniref:Cytochrome P450 n=1 Tax=Cryptolaemus montrouzieri TaxID=559131 RepID=A0ABD2NDL5_9CUCU
MVYHSRILVENLGSEVDKPAFNVKKYIQRSVCDLINETIIGVKTDANSGSLDYYLQTINRMYIVVHARIAKFWLQIEWIFKLTNYYKEQEEGKKVIHGFMRDAYHEVDKLYKYDKESSSSILAEMLKIREVIPDFAGEWGFIYHLTTFYSASEDTIAVISSFCLVVFGLFPNIQKKAYEEINSHLAIGKVIEENDINKMEYLEMCIKDVLRLFPAAPFIIRTAAKDFQLDELLIPKGCSIILAIHNIHRDSDYWNTPDTFNPDHFKPEEVAKRPKHAYLPFSAGTRSCLGKIYAMQGLKVILATILREFSLRQTEKIEKATTDVINGGIGLYHRTVDKIVFTFRRIEDRIKQCLLELKKRIIRGIPELKIPIMDPFRINKFKFGIKLKSESVEAGVKNVTVRGISRFILNDIKCSFPRPWMVRVNLNIILPSITAAGIYRMNALIGDTLQLNGTGKFWARVHHIELNTSTLLQFRRFRPRISDLGVNVRIRKLQNNFEGLNKDKETNELFNRLISETAPEAVNILWKELRRPTEKFIINFVNSALGNASIARLVRRLFLF